MKIFEVVRVKSQYKKVRHPEEEGYKWMYPVNWGESDAIAGTPQTEDITSAIHQLVKEMGQHPWDINNGDCKEFAFTLAPRVKGAEVEETGFAVWDDAPEPIHFFIKFKGKYYDAQAPNGVTKWRDLPIFRGEDKEE